MAVRHWDSEFRLGVFDVKVVDAERWCFEKSLPCVLAVDPGISTGLAVAWVDPDALFDPGRKVNSAIVAWGCTTLRGNENEQIDVIRQQIALLGAFGFVGVVTEDFIPRRLDQSRDFLSPVRINAVLEYMLFRGIGVAELPDKPSDIALVPAVRKLFKGRSTESSEQGSTGFGSEKAQKTEGSAQKTTQKTTQNPEVSRRRAKSEKVGAQCDGDESSYQQRSKSPQFHTENKMQGVKTGVKSEKSASEYAESVAPFFKNSYEVGEKSAYLLSEKRKKGLSMIRRSLMRQSPNDAKNVINDGRLRIWNMYTPGPDHARDATRHVLLWLRKMKASGWETFKEMHGVGKTQ